VRLGAVDENNYDVPLALNPTPVAHHPPSTTIKPLTTPYTTLIAKAHSVPLLFWLTSIPNLVTVIVATLSTVDLYKGTILEAFNKDGSITKECGITHRNIT